MAIFAIFLAKLIDPIAIVLAVVGALCSRAWWHVGLVAIVAASIVEMVLSSSQVTRTFNPIVFLIGVLAAGVWAALAFWIKQKWQKK